MTKYYVKKYKSCGKYTEWKEVPKEVAEHKAQIKVLIEWEGIKDWYYPYSVKKVEG